MLMTYLFRNIFDSGPHPRKGGVLRALQLSPLSHPPTHLHTHTHIHAHARTHVQKEKYRKSKIRRKEGRGKEEQSTKR